MLKATRNFTFDIEGEVMERKYSLTKSMVAGALIAAGFAMKPAFADDNLSARSAMVTIDVPCDRINANGVCVIDQVYIPSDKTCRATITPKGRIASQRAFFRDRSGGRIKSPSMLTFGFVLDNYESYNGTDVQRLTLMVTGNPDGKQFKEIQDENNGLLVELLDENRGIDFLYYGDSGASGDVGILTSSDGQNYNKKCKQEIQAGKNGVSVKAIQNGEIGTCAAPNRKDTSLSNDDTGGDLVTYEGSSIDLAAGLYLLTVSGNLKSMYDDDDDDNLMILASKRIRVTENCKKDT